MAEYFINKSSKLVINSFFFKCNREIKGITITELWGDSYKANLDLKSEVLFPADFNCPFKVVEHTEKKKEFIEKGGGFRLDFAWEL